MSRKSESKRREGPSDGLTELIGRALTDEEFRAQLFEQREKAITGYRLSEKDLESLGKLDRAELEKASTQLVAKKDIRIMIVISKSF